MSKFAFNDPWVLLLLPLLPWLLYRFVWRPGRAGAMRFSSLQRLGRAKPSLRVRLVRLPTVLRILALALLILAAARPQLGHRSEEVLTEGIDIMIALDISGSMRAHDTKDQSRLEDAKDEAINFIDGRQGDRIGLATFAGIAFTQCPLTLDYAVLKKFIEQVSIIDEANDGTAIGSGIATALNRLRDSDAESKVLILLTDGDNNAGKIEPVTAAELAKSMGVKIYTIGMGRDTGAFMPVTNPLFGTSYRPIPANIDVDLLQRIAKTTGGQFFRAQDRQGLMRTFEEIDRMERTEIELQEYYRYEERFAPFALLAFALVVIEITLSQTWLRRIP